MTDDWIEEEGHDPVSAPRHYTQGDIEHLDAMESCLGPRKFEGFLHGQVFKYQWRYEHKNGSEDLKKLMFYAERLVKHLEKLEVNRGW